MILVLIRMPPTTIARARSASRSRCRPLRVPEYLMAALADLVDVVARLEQRLRILLIDRGQGHLHRVLERSRVLVPAAGALVDQRANLVGLQLDARRQGPGARWRDRTTRHHQEVGAFDDG